MVKPRPKSTGFRVYFVFFLLFTIILCFKTDKNKPEVYFPTAREETANENSLF